VIARHPWTISVVCAGVLAEALVLMLKELL